MSVFQEPNFWKHQVTGRARAKARGNKGFAFFWEPGTGKTLMTITAIRDVMNEMKEFKKVLIFCPKIVVKNWKAEFGKFSKVEQKRILPLYGPTKKRIEQIQKSDGRIIVVTNYEAVAASSAFFNALLAWGPEILVLDESQKIKTHNSSRTKLVTELADARKGKGPVYLLSGTAILNSPADLFAQFRAMDESIFGRNFFAFRSVYFYDKNAGMPKQKYFPDWRIRPNAEEEIQKKIAEASMVVKKSECLDLPPLIKKIIEVELSPIQQKHYDEMAKQLVTYFSDEQACVAELALTKLLRLQQIVSGHMKLDDGTIVTIDDNPRRDALKEILEEICPANKIIVWCVFKQDYKVVREVCNELKLGYVEAHGEISDKAKFQAVEDFNSNPDFPVFIGHPASLGIGINLVAAAYSCRYSRDFSRENKVQSDARNYRGGSEIHKSITQIELIATGTQDEKTYHALESKDAMAETILKDWRA